MPDTTLKNQLFFDLLQNIKNNNEMLSREDLEIAIKAVELAKKEVKEQEQKRIRNAQLEELKKEQQAECSEGKELYLPKGLRSLNAEAFKNNEEIVKVVINEGCREIGREAFAGCTNLKEVVFPKKRIILRRGCFKGCSSIRSVWIHNIANIGPNAFEHCIRLKSVWLPSNISNIYSEAFKDCVSLQSVTFAKKKFYSMGDTSVFSKAFENCISLKTIEFAPLTSVDTESFINCSNLKKIYIQDGRVYQKKFKDCDAEIIRR